MCLLLEIEKKERLPCVMLTEAVYTSFCFTLAHRTADLCLFHTEEEEEEEGCWQVATHHSLKALTLQTTHCVTAGCLITQKVVFQGFSSLGGINPRCIASTMKRSITQLGDFSIQQDEEALNMQEGNISSLSLYRKKGNGCFEEQNTSVMSFKDPNRPKFSST